MQWSDGTDNMLRLVAGPSTLYKTDCRPIHSIGLIAGLSTIRLIAGASTLLD